MEIHADQILFVVKLVQRLYVHVFQITWVDRQIVDPSVLWIPIVRQRWLVFVINVKALVMAHVDPMLTAPFYITKRIVFVMMVFKAIHTADAVKSLSVRKIGTITEISANELGISLLCHFSRIK